MRREQLNAELCSAVNLVRLVCVQSWCFCIQGSCYIVPSLLRPSTLHFQPTLQVLVTKRRAFLSASKGVSGNDPLEEPRKMFFKLGPGDVRFFQ